MLGCEHGRTKVVEFLLSIGELDVHRRDADGRTAVDYARDSGQPHLVDLLM